MVGTSAGYPFLVELHLDEEKDDNGYYSYESCDDDMYCPEFIDPLYEFSEAFAARVDEEMRFFAPANLFAEKKPRLLQSMGELWEHSYYAKEDGLVQHILPRFVVLLKDCDHWDYHFIKASEYMEIPGFTIYGHYPKIDNIARQTYLDGELGLGFLSSEQNGEKVDAYTGAKCMNHTGFDVSLFQISSYLKAISNAENA